MPASFLELAQEVYNFAVANSRDSDSKALYQAKQECGPHALAIGGLVACWIFWKATKKA